MKISKYTIFLFLTPFFFLFCQYTFSQNTITDSSISIKINKSIYVVSGIVGDEQTRGEIVEKVKTQLDENADFRQLKVDAAATPFNSDWRKKFNTSLSKLKSWKSGIFIFSNENVENSAFPAVPEEILNIKVTLANETKPFSLAEYEDDVVLLFFIESWCGPCIAQADALEKLRSQISSANLRIIGISQETSAREKEIFQEFLRRKNYAYQFGWIDTEKFQSFTKISKFQAIPQTFLIYKEKIHGIFLGGGQKVNQNLNKLTVRTLKNNHL